MITYFAFKDMNIKVDRPESITHKDKHIGNRCYEKLKGIKQEDDWTREMDELIKKYNIKFEKVSVDEIRKVANKSRDITVRV